jgi:ECF transporter S component (folate family)
MSNYFNLLASTPPKPFDFADIFRNIRTRWYVYVVIAVAVLIVIVFSLLKKRKRNNLSSTQKIVYTAMMSALCFLANYLTIPVSELLQVSLIATAGFVSGYILGSGLGFASAFIGDLICAIIRPTGVYSPVINFGSGLMGFIPGLIFERTKLNDYLKTVISMVTVFIVASLLVNTVGLCLLYGFPMEIYIARLPSAIITNAINYVICFALVSVFPRILPKNKFNL